MKDTKTKVMYIRKEKLLVYQLKRKKELLLKGKKEDGPNKHIIYVFRIHLIN